LGRQDSADSDHRVDFITVLAFFRAAKETLTLFLFAILFAYLSNRWSFRIT